MLAQVDVERQAAALLEYVRREVLGDVASSLPEEASRQAWRSCGQMLRRAHAIAHPPGVFGTIVGDHIQPFAEHFASEESPFWGHSQIHMLLDHLQRLRTRMPDLARVDEDLRSVLAEALSYLNRAPPSLLHNDAHPWNVLVHADEDEWRCSAWLDWEYAWVGDPNWDLVRMDLFRRKPIGVTPDAFWEGHGRSPAEPERSVYTLGSSVYAVARRERACLRPRVHLAHADIPM